MKFALPMILLAAALSGQQSDEKWLKDPGSEWMYHSKTDLMGRPQLTAQTFSTNTVSFRFPYEGPQKAILMVRQNNKQTEVLFTLPKGQFVCWRDIDNNCVIAARFDNDSKIRWFAVAGSTDLSHNTWFIMNTRVKVYGVASFYNCIRKAKTVSIEATVYQEGNQIFQFNIADLNF